MGAAYHVFRKQPTCFPEEFIEASAFASQLRNYLDSDQVLAEIASCHKLHASSHEIQAIIRPELERLGFQSEKAGLFASYHVSALRPDFYRRVGRSGILLEVERGKTLTNNMDLLDMWKCHVCKEADFLFLIVPVERHSEKSGVIRAYDGVVRRLATFFEPHNFVNVEAAFIFGY